MIAVAIFLAIVVGLYLLAFKLHRDKRRAEARKRRRNEIWYEQVHRKVMEEYTHQEWENEILNKPEPPVEPKTESDA